MPISTHDGILYEDEMDQLFDRRIDQSDGPQKHEPLRLTIHPRQDDMTPGPVSGTGEDMGGLTEPQEVHIVRHGETTANDSNTVRGTKIPITLNETGRQEAEKAADELKSKGVDTLVSSDLPRARETAEIIGKKLGITPQYDPRLRTWDVGKYEGQDCDKANPDLKDYAKNKQDETVPGGESFNDFTNRSFAGIRDAVLNNKGKNVALVTHNRVEQTLKGWQKTGQDNPDIDYNEVVKETTPGNVRSMTFQPDSTIMNTFDDRFVGEPVQKGNFMDSSNFASNKQPVQTQLGEPGWFHTDSYKGKFGFTDPRFPGKIMNMPLNEETGSGVFLPVSGVKMYPGKGPTVQTDTPFAGWAARQGDTLAEQIMDIFSHPENMVGAGKLGTTIPKGPLGPKFLQGIKALADEGKSFGDIGKMLDISRDTVKGIMERAGIKSKNIPTQDKRVYISSSKTPVLDKDFDELATWYQNQFEGAPIEGEKPKYHVYDIQTGKAVTEKGYSNRNAARSLAEKKNLEWGAHRYYAMAEHLHDEPIGPISEGGPVEPEYNFNEMDKRQLDEFTARRMKKNVANENVKDHDTIEHPLMNLFEHWVGKQKSPTQEAYEKALAKQLEGRLDVSKDKYPNTYQIKDKDVFDKLAEVDKYLDNARQNWELEGYPPDLFEKEFSQKHEMKEELSDRFWKQFRDIDVQARRERIKQGAYLDDAQKRANINKGWKDLPPDEK